MKRLLSFSRRRGRLRLACWLCALAAWSSAVVGTLLQAQISEADKKKRDAFLKAREEMRTVKPSTPSKAKKASGKPKAATKKKKRSSTGSSSKRKRSSVKKKSSDSEQEDEESSSSRKKSTPEPTPEPTKQRAIEEELPRPASTPRATSAPQRSLPPADITIQKSGIEEEQGPAPTPPPPRGFWERVFGSGRSSDRSNYRYLTRGVIDAIRRAPVQRSRWKFIIVHNSGTRQGNARAFDYYHKRVRRMQNGLAYHFVVGNGRSSGNGEIEIGNRWTRQINGGHVHSDYLNNISLGICLVGDFNRDQPTRAQLEATEELVKYLRERCGKADGRAIPVRPHREMNPPRWATDCPGDAFPYGWFRRF